MKKKMNIKKLKESVEIGELIMRAFELEQKKEWIERQQQGIENKRLVGYIG
jgi:hypothetical protein